MPRRRPHLGLGTALLSATALAACSTPEPTPSPPAASPPAASPPAASPPAASPPAASKSAASSPLPASAPASTPEAAPERAPATDLVEGQTAFAADLYSRLRADPGTEGRNIFISPVSISTAFGLLQAGAQNETARQIASVLRFPEDVSAEMAAFARDVQSEEEGRVFALTNAVFTERSLALSPRYEATVRDAYASEVPRVDFASDPKGAEAIINAWVKTNTRGLIPSVYNNTVQRDWILSLVNTAYLKAQWAETFPQSATEPATFDTPDGPVDVDMMHRTGVTDYSETDGFQAVTLPYTQRTMAMTLVLPRDGTTLEELEAEVGADMLAEIDRQRALQRWSDTREAPMQRIEVDLFVPRMDISDSHTLNDSLIAMGMVDAFADADFDGIYASPIGNDAISSVIHKTRLKVDEDGTEAAAVTAIGIYATSLPPPPDRRVTFRMDRPALMFIRHEATEAVLFMGRIVNPVAG